MKRILILYGSVGLGHKVVAENIGHTLRSFPGIEVRMLDVLEMYRGPLTQISRRIYERIIRYAPWLWGFFYSNRFFQALSLPLRIPFARRRMQSLGKYLKEINPDLVLSSHPTPTALAVALKQAGLYRGPVFVTFSDFHFQPFWVYPEVQKYFVVTSEQKQEVMKRGYDGSKVLVTGLPVHEYFYNEYGRNEVFEEFGLDASKPVILVMGGSRSWGIRVEDIEALLKTQMEMQIVVLVGLNPGLFEKLQKLSKKYPGKLKVFSDLETIEVAKFFSVAEILITKPGGLTIAQAIAARLPMILINPLPAMEILNQDFLLSKKAALAAGDSSDLAAKAEQLIKNEKLLSEIRDNLKKLDNPKAAWLAARSIIDTLNIRD